MYPLLRRHCLLGDAMPTIHESTLHRRVLYTATHPDQNRRVIPGQYPL